MRQIISRAVVSDEVVDIFSAAGLKRPDIGLLSDEFLEDVRHMKERNLAVELLERLLKGEIKSRFSTNVVKSAKFSELLRDSLLRYRNRAIETAQIIEELIAMAKEFQKEAARGVASGLSPDDEASFPGRVTRGPAAPGEVGPIVSVDRTFLNGGTTHQSGIDVALDWRVRSSVGVWTPALAATYMTKFLEGPITPGAASIDRLSRASSDGVFAPRWKGIASIGWTPGPAVDLSLAGRYIGSYTDYTPPRKIGNRGLGVCERRRAHLRRSGRRSHPGRQTGRTPAIGGARSTPIFRPGAIAFASWPRTTAASGTNRAHRSTSRSSLPGGRRPGSARSASSRSRCCCSASIACAFASCVGASRSPSRRASPSARASRATCTTRCCRASTACCCASRPSRSCCPRGRWRRSHQTTRQARFNHPEAAAGESQLLAELGRTRTAAIRRCKANGWF